MRSVSQVFSQAQYQANVAESIAFNQGLAKAWSTGDVDAIRKFQGIPGQGPERERLAKAIVEAHAKAIVTKLQKAGLNTSVGFNFYDLRGPALLLYPVYTPLRNSMARIGRVNDGYGTAAHWMASRDPGQMYAGVSEGQRNAKGTPDNIPYVATYKELGFERGVTFTAQWAGEGYTDNVADEHIRGMQVLQLQEEGMILNGNAGTAAGNNGFALGTPNTPTSALVEAAGITTARYVSAYVVELTAMGYPAGSQFGYQARPTVASGLTPSFTRTNADGSQDTINGGISAISAKSTAVLTATTNLQVRHTVVPKAGAIAWAWYTATKATDDATAAEHFLTAITTVPTYLQTANSPTTGQAANFAGSATDRSYETRDFDGLLTYAATKGRWVNQLGADFTSDGAGGIPEIDADLEYLFTEFQSGPDRILVSGDVSQAISQTIGPTAGLVVNMGPNNTFVGGYSVSQYKSRFAVGVGGGRSIPIEVHPFMPNGTIYYDIGNMPPAYAHSRAPFVRGMMVQREYYGIEWPLQTREWTFGTYVHEVLAHMVPWMSAVRTGIGGPAAAE